MNTNKTASDLQADLRELEKEMEELYEEGRDLILKYLDAVEREAGENGIDPECALVDVPGFLGGQLTDYPWVVGLNKTLSAELHLRVKRYTHGASARKALREAYGHYLPKKG